MITMHGIDKQFHIVKNDERGIALLITLLTVTVLMGISASLLNVTLKQFQFSSIGLQSEMAFQAANAGMECMLGHDFEGFESDISKFDIGRAPQAISCMESPGTARSGPPSYPSPKNPIESEEEQVYQFSWKIGSSPEICSNVSIFKFKDDGASIDMDSAVNTTGLGTCPQGLLCTVIKARGYNVACADILNPRTIERELTIKY